MRLIASSLVIVVSASAAAVDRSTVRPVSTYSIVARDASTGELGVAVPSLSVGSVVPWAEAGVGAVATQSFVEPSYGPLGLAMMPGRQDVIKSGTPTAIPSLLITGGVRMTRFVVWLILLILCWPLAVLALVLYPFVWLLLLPFRIVGLAVEGVLGLLRGILFLPARILRGPARA